MLRPRVMAARPSGQLQQQLRQIRMQPTRALRRTHEDEHRAHTISQRIRQIKKIPIELVPLGVVLAIAVVAAVYSLSNKLMSDKTLRLSRQGRKDD